MLIKQRRRDALWDNILVLGTTGAAPTWSQRTIIHDRGPTSVQVASLVVQIITAATALYLARLGLRLSAKPRIDIDLHPRVHDRTLPRGSEVTFTARLTNRGYWYGKPAATKTIVYFNFDPPAEPLRMRYGSVLELTTDQVRTGKGGSRYLTATGIYLVYGEPPEEVEVDVRLPEKQDTYAGRITVISAEGGQALLHFHYVVG